MRRARAAKRFCSTILLCSADNAESMGSESALSWLGLLRFLCHPPAARYERGRDARVSRLGAAKIIE